MGGASGPLSEPVRLGEVHKPAAPDVARTTGSLGPTGAIHARHQPLDAAERAVGPTVGDDPECRADPSRTYDLVTGLVSADVAMAWARRPAMRQPIGGDEHTR